MKSRAFTLIELLVVIAIIALLSSIVLASLNSARVKSRNARRMSDMKALQIALELYKQDHGGDAPTGSIYLDGVSGSFNTFKSLLVGGGYIASIPLDPTAVDTSTQYYFCNYSDPALVNGHCEIRTPNDVRTYVIKFDMEGISGYYCLTPQGIHKESTEDDSTDAPTESATACEQR